MKHGLTLVVILLLAALLRVQRITQPYIDPMGWRQASTAMMADSLYRGDTHLLRPAVRWGGPGKGYQAREFQMVTAIAAAGYQIFGRTDWVGRAVVIAFGLWGIVALYLLVLRVWGREAAGLAAAMMAVLPGAVYLERTFVPDPAMAALATTALWLLVEAIRLRRHWLLALAAAVWTLACLTKLQALILMGPAVYCLWAWPALSGHGWRSRGGMALAAAALVPLMMVAAYYGWVVISARSQATFHLAGEGKYLWDADLMHWLRQGYFLPTVAWILVSWMWSAPALVLVVAGVVLKPPRTGTIPARWVFHTWALALIPLYLVEAQHMASDPQNLAILNPCAAALAGRAVMGTVDGVRPWVGRLAAGLLAVLLVLGVAVTGQIQSRSLFADYYPHWEMHVLGVELAERAAPDELVISMGVEPIAIYYSGLRGWVFPPSTVRPAADDPLWLDTPQRIDMLEELRSRGATWLIVPASQYWGPLLTEHLERHYPLVHHTSAGYIFRLTPQATR